MKQSHKRLQMQEVSFDQLPGWKSGNLQPGFAAFLREDHSLHSTMKTVNPKDSQSIRNFITKHFTPYLVKDIDDDQGLFTGYYQPVALASKVKTSRFTAPIYRKPPELIVIEDLVDFRQDLAGIRLAGHLIEGEFRPYYTRAQINQGILDKRSLEIAWIESLVDAFFMAVQGSGLLQFEDGTQVAISYGGANGYPYQAIGKVMIEKGFLAKGTATMQSIRQWLADHPDQCLEILNTNPSYIFFKELDYSMPEGAHKVGLTPMGSLAVDPHHIPLGSLMWLSTQSPELNSLVVAQDTGSAIKGVIRGDFYWGTGPEAGEMAGKMSTRGQYFLLQPKTLDK